MIDNLANENTGMQQQCRMTIKQKIELLYELQCIDQQIMRIIHERGYGGEAREEIDRLNAVRPSFPDMLRSVLWREYQNRWRTSRDETPSPIALVRDRCCGGCGNELSAVSLSILDQQDPSGVIILCEHCDRILFSKETLFPKRDCRNRAPDRVYFSHCWNCHQEIHSSSNEQCTECGFFICNHCGECLCGYPHSI